MKNSVEFIRENLVWSVKRSVLTVMEGLHRLPILSEMMSILPVISAKIRWNW